ncbi:outer membrane protein assembly factor BamA [Bradyrhizobium sp. Arg237L]|uniref:outer membrane protein assembly factor BamA n=1 Tax=Bradyrhizobium sp. Arg237L TaxID=3003352 RepID=UPI00249F81FF|nr:outer membrane protein assembly factor BamA [Bradyrhizobium sp. Arg237L]MDI4233008.1 outer membrane protein assembly factor BamA [Bradyrhizobium sp. Arg237L]
MTGLSLVATAVLLNAVASLAAESVPVPTATIIVEGNRRVEADTVRSYFHPGPDGRLDEAARNEALKALVATGLFEKVSIEPAGDRLTVHVTEAPTLDRVAFEGNRKIKDADLAAAIESKPRGSLQRSTVQGDIGRIIEAYRHVGRDDVRVAPEIIDRGNGRVDLVYVITEGTKTPVRRISFVGNRAFGARQLNAVIKTSATNMLSFLTGGDVYDPDRIAQDQQQLRLYYRSKGYADATVRSATAEYDPAAKGFAVTFAIDEGPLYHFGDISVACNIPGLDPQKLRGVALAHVGAVFDGNALDKSTELLAIEMAKLGYPFAQAVPRIARDAAAQRIDVAFVIDQGPRTYVERIEIHGNTHTRDYVIRREFDIAEGDPYNKTLIDRAERRLKNLNYFKTVKITNRPGSTPDRVVLDVETLEQATGEFNISGGYSSTDGALIELKVGDRNFYGTGKNVQASVTYGQYARGIDLAASEPYFLGTKVSAGIELFGRQSEANSYQSYNSTTYGSTLQFGTPITEQLGVQWRYSIYNQDISLGPTNSGLTPSLAVQQAAANGPAWVSAVGSTSTYSTLDNNKSPTSGFRSQLSQDLAGLGGDVKFLRTSEDARYYQTLTGDLVGMVRAQGGYVTGWGGQQVPLMNSFFGGPTMVRGFATNGFGPRDLTPGTTMDNIGGSAYWATTAELQSGIPGVPDEYGLKASAFVDAGSVFRYTGPTSVGGTALQVAGKNVVRSSVGMGLTWASPFGALTVDYAVPLTKAAYDVVQPLRFSAGGF